MLLTTTLLSLWHGWPGYPSTLLSTRRTNSCLLLDLVRCGTPSDRHAFQPRQTLFRGLSLFAWQSSRALQVLCTGNLWGFKCVPLMLSNRRGGFWRTCVSELVRAPIVSTLEEDTWWHGESVARLAYSTKCEVMGFSRKQSNSWVFSSSWKLMHRPFWIRYATIVYGLLWRSLAWLGRRLCCTGRDWASSLHLQCGDGNALQFLSQSSNLSGSALMRCAVVCLN